MSVLPPQHQRVGAHRARRNPIAATATAAAAAVALTALLLWGLSTTFFGDGDTAQAGGAGVEDGATAQVTGALEIPSGDPSPSPSVPPTSSAPPPSPTTTAPPPPVVDQASTIAVLNGGKNVRGVASGAVAQLVAAGWTGIDPALTGNTPDFPNVPATAVYYSDPAQVATAQALAAALGTGTAQVGDFAANGWTTQLVVVLGADFPDPPA